MQVGRGWGLGTGYGHQSSLVGTFGEQVQRTAKEFVKCGLVQVVASDAHTLKNRGFAMTKAYDVLNEMN
ncbi:CpsB/CapC family capsule biosynthesis tyrosine phosphatase [Secundilactobacillus oryzae]|uniref:CpsB/CapC family capsule biosynthesis tyrosine phosphatase n=1 Tax=Secundilactobacillus oryzae TaxID=1202668 RepID=UPI001F4268E0|nr:CpsB/CapC family capsule biosynthesis tyrosine phosphatase [Secundilactobacillus oryzae]